MSHVKFVLDDGSYRLGLKIAIADVNEVALTKVGKELAATIGEGNVLIVPTDVSKLEQVQALSKRVYDAWGEVRIRATSEVQHRAPGTCFVSFPLLSHSPPFPGTTVAPSAIACFCPSPPPLAHPFPKTLSRSHPL